MSEVFLCYYDIWQARNYHHKPRQFSSLHCLYLVQLGIQSFYSQRSPDSNTNNPSYVTENWNHWIPRAKDPETIIFWVAATVFWLFLCQRNYKYRSYVLPSALAWSNVTINNLSSPDLLEEIKNRPGWKGSIQTYWEKAGGNDVQCTLACMVSKEPKPDPFFKKDDTPLSISCQLIGQNQLDFFTS